MIFRRAALKLTISFAVVQLVLFAGFALGVYAYVTAAFDFDSVDGDGEIATAENGFATLRVGLLLAYAVLVLVIPLTSYALAALALRPIRAGYEAQQRFVDDASHEVRTPLSALQAQLELGLARRRTVAEYRQVMTRSLGAVARLDRMLAEMLMLTRSDRDLARDRAPVDLAAVLADVVEQFPEDVRARVDASPASGIVVQGSSAMIGRAVSNLLSNAARYSPPDSRIRIRITQRGGRGRLEVADDGIGMSQRERRRAFDRFWRADSSRAVEGSGLGLSIVQEIVRLHHGRVRVVSKSGAGTTVRLDFPLSR
jgi:signal transduction histidine kinase